MDAPAYAAEYIEQDARQTDFLAFIPLLPGNHCYVIQLPFNGKWTYVNTNLFLDASLASGWSLYL
jgi:hypothetical protein